jgi:hypothetical protein
MAVKLFSKSCALLMAVLVLRTAHGCSFEGTWEVSAPLPDFPVNVISNETVDPEAYQVGNNLKVMTVFHLELSATA